MLGLRRGGGADWGAQWLKISRAGELVFKYSILPRHGRQFRHLDFDNPGRHLDYVLSLLPALPRVTSVTMSTVAVLALFGRSGYSPPEEDEEQAFRSLALDCFATRITSLTISSSVGRSAELLVRFSRLKQLHVEIVSRIQVDQLAQAVSRIPTLERLSLKSIFNEIHRGGIWRRRVVLWFCTSSTPPGPKSIGAARLRYDPFASRRAGSTIVSRHSSAASRPKFPNCTNSNSTSTPLHP